MATTSSGRIKPLDANYFIVRVPTSSLSVLARTSRFKKPIEAVLYSDSIVVEDINSKFTLHKGTSLIIGLDYNSIKNIHIVHQDNQSTTILLRNHDCILCFYDSERQKYHLCSRHAVVRINKKDTEKANFYREVFAYNDSKERLYFACLGLLDHERYIHNIDLSNLHHSSIHAVVDFALDILDTLFIADEDESHYWLFVPLSWVLMLTDFENAIYPHAPSLRDHLLVSVSNHELSSDVNIMHINIGYYEPVHVLVEAKALHNWNDDENKITINKNDKLWIDLGRQDEYTRFLGQNSDYSIFIIDHDYIVLREQADNRIALREDVLLVTLPHTIEDVRSWYEKRIWDSQPVILKGQILDNSNYPDYDFKPGDNVLVSCQEIRLTEHDNKVVLITSGFSICGKYEVTEGNITYHLYDNKLIIYTTHSDLLDDIITSDAGDLEYDIKILGRVINIGPKVKNISEGNIIVFENKYPYIALLDEKEDGYLFLTTTDTASCIVA